MGQPRPSLSALSASPSTPYLGGEPANNDFAGRAALADERANGGTPTYEARRQMAEDSLDMQGDEERKQREEASDNALFELGSGRAAARAKMEGDIVRSEADANAGAQLGGWQNVLHGRQQRESMDALRASKLDPVLAGNAGKVDVADIAGRSREAAAGITGAAREGAAATTAAGRITGSALANSGADALAGDPTLDRISHLMPNTPGVGPGKALPQGFDIAGYAQSRRLSMPDALAEIRAHGYAVP